MITLDRLKYFCEVAKLEHVGQAAKSLHISASSISDAIKELEEELSCQLFIRVNNRIKLNENGKMLLKKAEHILFEANNLASSIHQHPPKLEGHFKVAASPYLMKHYLLEACLKIKKTNPNISFSFISLETSEAIDKTLRGDVDMALVFNSLTYQQVHAQALYLGNFEIALKKSHSIFNLPQSKRIQELNRLPAITFKPNALFNYVENHPIFKEFKINPQHSYYYNNNDSSLWLLKETQGWAFLPDIIIKNNKKSIKNLPLGKLWKAPYEISLMQAKSKPNEALFNKLNQELSTILKQL